MHDVEVRNNIEILKKRNLIVHDEVYQLKFVPSHYCNLKCEFCGITPEPGKVMSMETFNNAIKDLTPHFKMAYFSGHGEPTLNKNLPDMIELLRKTYPQVQINVISNGVIIHYKGIEYLENLFDKGLNRIQIDCYQEITYDFLRNSATQLRKKGIVIEDYYQTGINPFGHISHKTKLILYVRDYTALNTQKSCTRKLHNWGGNLKLEHWEKDIKKLPFKKTCSEPYKYMTIYYNGDVSLCCRDGGRSIVTGNVNNNTATEIWNSDNYRVVRYLLKLGHRDKILPCSLCNYSSFRDGLYPFYQKKPSIEEIKNVLNSIKKEPTPETMENIRRINEYKRLHKVCN